MKSIRGKILALNLAIILLCTLILGGTSILFMTRSQEKDADQILSLSTDRLAEKINTDLYSIQNAVDSLSVAALNTLPSVSSLKKQSIASEYVSEMEYIMKNLGENTSSVCTYYLRLAPELTSVPEGFVYSRSSTDEKPVKVPLTDLSLYDPDDTEHVGWYYQPKKAGKPIWMEPYYNRNMDIYMISYIVPLFKDGIFLGVLGMDVDFKQVNDALQDNKPYKTSHAFIVSDRGRIYYPPEKMNADNIAEISPELASLRSTFGKGSKKADDTITYELNGVRRVLAHSHTINGMNLLLDTETGEIYASRNVMVIITLLAALLLGLVSVIISMRASLHITEPLNKLTQAANKIADGDMNVELPETTDDEVGILAESMGKTVESLRTYITGMTDKAYTDSLTHVRNKTSFDITMGGFAQKMAKGDRQFGILMLDVNNLKQTNDNFGHSVGDDYLVNCCHLICQTFKHSPVFRIGGDEFVVILEGTDLEHYRDLIAEMDSQMASSLQEEQPQNRLSIAKGASFCMPNDNTPEEVFQRADRMMYIDKRKMKEADPDGIDPRRGFS